MPPRAAQKDRGRGHVLNLDASFGRSAPLRKRKQRCTLVNFSFAAAEAPLAGRAAQVATRKVVMDPARFTASSAWRAAGLARLGPPPCASLSLFLSAPSCSTICWQLPRICLTRPYFSEARQMNENVSEKSSLSFAPIRIPREALLIPQTGQGRLGQSRTAQRGASGPGKNQQRLQGMIVRCLQGIDICAPGRARIDETDAAPAKALSSQTGDQQVGGHARKSARCRWRTGESGSVGDGSARRFHREGRNRGPANTAPLPSVRADRPGSCSCLIRCAGPALWNIDRPSAKPRRTCVCAARVENPRRARRGAG